jgi:hypothetical protein
VSIILPLQTLQSRTLKARTINEREDNALKDLLDLKTNNNKAITILVFTRKSLRK